MGTAHVTGYCAVRLPVSDLDRAHRFYCDVVGFSSQHATQHEAVLAPPSGGPVLYLMHVADAAPHQVHWEQWGELYTAFELYVDDVGALRDRLDAAGARRQGDPFFRGGYLTLGFFDPDGNFLFAVDRRGRYFQLSKQLEERLQRPLSPDEDARLQRLGAATADGDELAVLVTLLDPPPPVPDVTS